MRSFLRTYPEFWYPFGVRLFAFAAAAFLFVISWGMTIYGLLEKVDLQESPAILFVMPIPFLAGLGLFMAVRILRDFVQRIHGLKKKLGTAVVEERKVRVEYDDESETVKVWIEGFHQTFRNNVQEGFIPALPRTPEQLAQVHISGGMPVLVTLESGRFRYWL